MSDLSQQPADRSVKITHLVFGLLFQEWQSYGPSWSVT